MEEGNRTERRRAASEWPTALERRADRRRLDPSQFADIVSIERVDGGYLFVLADGGTRMMSDADASLLRRA